MILSFDKFERYELPQVTLCNPNSRATEVDGKITITDTVGVLSNPKGMNLKLNFNAPHELSFDYYRHKSSDPIKQSFYDSLYEAIQTDRYIYLTDIGYFTIKNSTDSDEDNIDKKSISLKSCEENELATAEGLHLKEGVYYLHTENNDGLLDLFLPKTAGWTMGYIDPSLLTKPYFVEDTEVDNGYNFLYTTIQDMFECIVEPDIIRRTISVYSRVYYAEHHLTDIHIAKYNLLKHKTVEENDEDKYTALNVQGKDENLEIRTVNPTGKNVIYNFESRYSWMSPALQQAIEKWQEKCESVEEEYFNLQKGYYDELDLLFNEEQDVEVKKGELKQLEETRDAALIMTAGDERDQSVNNCNNAITAKQNEINTATSIYNTHKQTINTTYEIPITQINSDCALDITAKDIDGNTIFTIKLLNELMTHIKPTEYVDEYMLITESMTYPERFEKAKELMDRAQSQLVKISSGQKTYSIDTRSFLFNKQFKHFSEQLCAGAIIYVETKNDVMEQLHLTGIDINFDEKSTNFTLGNKYDRSDLKALYEDAFGQNSKNFTELKYIASIVEDQQKYYNRDWAAELRTLTLNNVLTSEDQAIEINNRGLTGRKRQLNEDGSWKSDENGNPLFDPEQVKLINNTLVFTNDNWNTAATAVGKIAVGYNPDGSVKYSYGINGQVLIGELILGNNLVLTGIGSGIKIKNNGGNDVFYANNKGDLILSGHIKAKSLTLQGCTIPAKDISGLSGVATSGSYNDLINKPQIPTSVKDLGLDTSEIIYKGDIKQSTKTDSNGIEYIQTTVPTADGGFVTYDTYDADNYIVFDRYVGKNEQGQNYICISKDGLLTARNALIYGTVYATEGDIAGWKIESTMFSKTGKDPFGNSFHFYLNSNPYSAEYLPPYNPVIGIVYNDEYKFYVRSNGQLYAKEADIEGKITATSGDIGNWTISGGNLVSDGKVVGGNQYYSNISPNQIEHVIKDNNGNQRSGISDNGLYIGYYASAEAYHRLYNSQYFFLGRTKNDFLMRYYYNGANDIFYIHTANFGLTMNDAGDAYIGWVGTNGFGAGAYINFGTTNSGKTKKGHLHGSWYSDSSISIASDFNKKNTINTLSDSYSILFDNLRPVTYKYNDGTSNRLHTGFIAQEVKDALDKANINSQDFAGLVISSIGMDDEEWYLRYEEFIALLVNEVQKLKAEKQQTHERLSKIESALGLS